MTYFTQVDTRLKSTATHALSKWPKINKSKIENFFKRTAYLTDYIDYIVLQLFKEMRELFKFIVKKQLFTSNNAIKKLFLYWNKHCNVLFTKKSYSLITKTQQ